MVWITKSESDTDKVLAEIDNDGNETGSYKYVNSDGVPQAAAMFAAQPAPHVPVEHVADLYEPTPTPERIYTRQLSPRQVAYTAGAGGIGGFVIAELLRLIGL